MTRPAAGGNFLFLSILNSSIDDPMTALNDLAPCDYLPVQSENLIAIGWLSKESNFERGTVDPEFFEKLTDLFKAPWQPMATAGSHACELCQFNRPRFYANVFIPFGGRIYVAPEGVLHYIAAHWYKPPDVFIEAVMSCPPMNSMEYKKALLANGGRDLVKAAAQQKQNGPTQLSAESIEGIRTLGLDVHSEPSFGPDHASFPNGYIVIKPTSTPGNGVPGWEGWFNNYRGVDAVTDAPGIYVWYKGGTWRYAVLNFVPGPGPGDFQRSVANEAELLARIGEYFFSPNADFEALKSAAT